jgi:hypothetical protein
MSTASEPAEHGQPSLRDSLELVVASLPSELVQEEAKPWLNSIASVLPPVHHAGFECRLGVAETTVDLQQGIFATDGGPARLVRFLAQAGAGAGAGAGAAGRAGAGAGAAGGAGARVVDETWERVRRLGERMTAPDDLLQRGVNEIWLELDANPDDGADQLTLNDARPSVFAVVERAGPEALDVALEVVRTLLAGQLLHAAEATLTSCSLACAEPARISHVGVMLGREVPALRVHIRDLPLQDLAAYLAAIGWTWEVDGLVSHATMLAEYGDWVVICLDLLGDQVLRVGLECFVAVKHGLDPRWAPLLERLNELGLSSAEKSNALLSWPGTVTPLDGAGPWPQDLIVQSLTQPEDTLTLLDRRLSHVKLTFAPGQAVNAKAYFGYVHVWMRDHPVEDAPN